MAGKKKVKEEIKADTRILDILSYQKKEPKFVEYDINGGTVSITISKSIPLEEAYDFVNVVVENCFIDGIYFPIYKNISIARALIVYFTDLHISENFDDIYKILNETNLMEDIKRYASMFQIHDLLSSIDEAISFEKEKILKNSAFEEMMVSLGDLIASGMDKLSQLDLTKVNFEKINSLVDGISSQIEVKPELV